MPAEVETSTEPSNSVGTLNLTPAIYARVSSEQQAEAGTIQSQLEALKQHVSEEAFHLESEFCFVDDGYSGATLIRLLR